jgi:RNA polymerase sigma-70 factor (ECF subfamily)
MDWHEIVRENAPGMLRLATRMVGSCSEAEELVQDAFLKAYQFQQRHVVQNWVGLLRRLLVNRALDHLRTRKVTVELDANHVVGSSDDPVQLAEMQELAQRLRREIGRLPAQQSEVFCLSHFDGKSNDQIAETLGVQVGAVATALHKARQRLITVLMNPMITPLKREEC